MLLETKKQRDPSSKIVPPSVLDNLPQISVLVLNSLTSIKIQVLVTILIRSYIKWKHYCYMRNLILIPELLKTLRPYSSWTTWP